MALGAVVVYGVFGDLIEISTHTYFQHRLPRGISGRFISLFLIVTGAGGVLGAGSALPVPALPALIVAVIFAVQEGGLRLARPPFAPVLEPEVVGHGMFGAQSLSDLIPNRAAGGALLQPRLHRLV